MHISFTVPTWALIGFGTVAYPSIGALVSSFLMRASSRRLPGWLVFSAGALWPATLALSAAAFPLWLVGWFMKNYGEAIRTVLKGKSDVLIVPDLGDMGSFVLGETVKMKDGWGSLNVGCYGIVKDRKLDCIQIDFPGIGTHWVPTNLVVRK